MITQNFWQEEAIQIPKSTYHRMLDHLALHAPTDMWAAELLRELETEVKLVKFLPSGSYRLDAHVEEEYQVD